MKCIAFWQFGKFTWKLSFNKSMSFMSSNSQFWISVIVFWKLVHIFLRFWKTHLQTLKHRLALKFFWSISGSLKVARIQLRFQLLCPQLTTLNIEKFCRLIFACVLSNKSVAFWLNFNVLKLTILKTNWGWSLNAFRKRHWN